MATIDDLAGYMQQQGLGTVGTDIFKGGLIAQPSTQYALIETGGREPLRELDNSAPVDRPTLQVLSRATAYQIASMRAMDAYLVFDAILHQVIGTAHYIQVEPIQMPMLLERVRSDDDWRHVFAFNVAIEVQR